MFENNEDNDNLNEFLNDDYDRYTGLYIKSKDFIKKVNQITKI